MRAGVKQRIVTLQVKTAPQDATGHPVETWSDVRTLRAQRMEGARVTERYASFQLAASIQVVFRVGYFPTFATVKPDTHRLVDENGVPLNILGLFEIGRKKGVEILCAGRTE